jgi:hypothetical protein
MTAGELGRLSNEELAEVMASAGTFDPAALAGSVYRGTSLGLPGWIERLTWKKFAKAFALEAGGVRGWNIRVEQDGLDRPWRPRRRAGAPITFGPFAVTTSSAGVVLDYNVRGGLMRALRDPLIALDADADLILGRSLLAIGGRRIATPSFFTLERDRALGPSSSLR